MYLLIRVDEESLLNRIIAYLKRLKIWHKQFREKIYQKTVSVEERIEKVRAVTGWPTLNPPRAWETCKHAKEIWAWDSMGRGPWDTGKIVATLSNPKAQKREHAGICKNPEHLNYISCPLNCPDYEPTTIEGICWLLTQMAKIHEEKAMAARETIEKLKRQELKYEEAIRICAVSE